MSAASPASRAGVALRCPPRAALVAGSAEAANIVACFASEQASYVTGCLLPADGGAIR
jgi:NAD(P)-dependent dehydrogenase (short-subunit alcohol dehydrogenase family)